MKANLIPIILKKNSKFKKFLMQTMKTTRNSLTINPLEEYSITSPTVVSANTLVKQGNYGFIGGDTEYLSYDMQLKVANSVVECPIKLYTSTATTLKTPSDITGNLNTGFVEVSSQSWLDTLKTLDSNCQNVTATITGQILQFMIELDLTPLCNSLYGGSNAALKSALKSINVDVWASGYGASTGVQTYGAEGKLWDGSTWQSKMANVTNAIAKMSYSSIVSGWIQATNKVYILINSQYASDGTIASSCSLDYINIGIQLSRTPDVVSPINVSLPKYWGVVGGFSPNFDSNRNGISNKIFALFTDSNNRFILSRQASNILFFTKVKSGIGTNLTASTTNTFSKNQVIRYIVGQNANGMFMYLLKNNGTVEKLTNTDTTILSGSMPLQLLNQNNLEQGDMFAEKFTLLDLNKLGRANGFSDAEADAILRGTVPNLIGAYNSELFDITKVSLHPNASLSGGVITLNATAGYQYSTVFVNVMPNNKYEVKGSVSNSNGYIAVDEYYNNILLRTTTAQITSTTSSVVFTTLANTNNVKFRITSTVAGTFTFSNISLKIKM